MQYGKGGTPMARGALLWQGGHSYGKGGTPMARGALLCMIIQPLKKTGNSRKALAALSHGQTLVKYYISI